MRRVAKNTIALLLVFTMVITLGLSAYASATDSGEDTQKFVDVKSEQDQTDPTNSEDSEVPEDSEEPAEPEEPGEPREPGEPGEQDEDLEELENLGKEEEILNLLEDFDTKSVEEQANILEYVEAIIEGMSREPLGEVQDRIDEAKELFESNTDLGELAEDYPTIDEPDILLPAHYFMRTMGLRSDGLVDTIAVNKTAVRSPGCRTFEVTLDITGKPQEAPVDVVLVIDRSGSMGFTATTNPTRTRLYYAKQAAINFAGRVLGQNGIPGSRVSVVSFSGPTTTSGYGNQNQASTDLDLSSDLTTVTNKINAISAVGGTNTEAGFKQGQSVIQGVTSNQNPNSNKVVIMFTDGLPTASNGKMYADTTNINHTHIQSAINAGKNIYQNNIADVFTIGLTTGMNATEKALADYILTQAQNKGYYPAPSATDLDSIFTSISQSLGYAATNAKVVDKIGDNFDLVASSLPAGASYDSDSREITWNPGTIYSSAQLKYIVRAKSDFAGGSADTNKYATLTYKDIFGNAGKRKYFPVPEVNVPTLIEISLTDATITSGNSISLGTGTNPNGENYMSPVTGGDNDGIKFTYEWRKVGDTTVLSTDKNPSVSPTEDTQYEVTVTDSNGCKAKDTMWVRVTKLTDVTISKVVTGNMSDRNRDFSFTATLTDTDGNNLDFTMDSNVNVTINGNIATFTLKHDESITLTDIPIGSKITVMESDNAGYTVSYSVNEGVSVGGSNAEAIQVLENGTTIEFSNHKDAIVDTGISLDQLPYIIMLVIAGLGALGIFIRKRKYKIE